MSKIEVDYSAVYNADSEIKKIVETASEAYKKINTAHDILALDNVLSHDYGKKLLSDIQSEQDKLARQKKLIEKYSNTMGKVADEYFEAETGSKSSARAGGWKLPIISGIAAVISEGIYTVSSLWDDLFGGGQSSGASHGGGGHTIGEDVNNTADDAPSQTGIVDTDVDWYSNYRTNVDKIGEVKGQRQMKGTDGYTYCTIAAMTTLLNRRSAYEGNAPDAFTGAYVAEVNKGKYRYTEGNSDYYDFSQGLSWGATYESGNASYTTAYDKSISSISSTEQKQEYLISMLEQHPEGVEIYSNVKYRDKNGNLVDSVHAVVITDYKKVGDTIQFYADDCVMDGYYRGYNNNRTELENSWLYQSKVSENFIDDIFAIWYIK